MLNNRFTFFRISPDIEIMGWLIKLRLQGQKQFVLKAKDITKMSDFSVFKVVFCFDLTGRKYNTERTRSLQLYTIKVDYKFFTS